MPLQNRVLATAEIVADPARGMLTGNRGIIHRDDRTLSASRWSHPAWICCTLDWQGRKRTVMSGRTWTELFFLDEAVALAAGHRPCAYCRRSAYRDFSAAWETATGVRPKAPQIDAALHAARLQPGTRKQQWFREPLSNLPEGTIIWHDGAPHLVTRRNLLPVHPGGYSRPTPRPCLGVAHVMTPAPTVQVLRAGYQPLLHATAHL